MGKLLFHLGPLDLIGGATQDVNAVGILTKADFVVIANQTGAAIATMTEVLRAVKLAKPTIKIFGYTDLGNAADLATWKLDVDAWATNTNLPTETLIDGIYVNNFGFSFGTSTRDNQNAAVTYIHGKNLSIMVSASPAFNILNKYASMADPLIGTVTTIKDFICLDGFYFDRQVGQVALIREAKESIFGRLDYTTGAKTTNNLNLGIVALANMYTTNTIPVVDYTTIHNLATDFNLDAVGFAADDYGSTTNNYFLFKKANDFTGP